MVSQFILLSFTGIGHAASVDVEKLPSSVPCGNFKPVTISSGNPTFIMFDLETTSLSKSTCRTPLLLYFSKWLETSTFPPDIL